MPAIQNTSISETSTDTVAIAAADTYGRKNKLHSITLTAVGEWTVQFKDGTTALSGAHTLEDGGVFVLDPASCSGIQSTANTALNVTLTRVSGSGTISGNAAFVVAA